MADDERPEEQMWEEGWEGHQRAQRRRMARLPLAQKLLWLENAQQLVLQLWTDEEFIALLQSHNLDDADAGRPIKRSAGAVAAVRAGLHAWHQGKHQTMLSQKMTSVLGQTGRARHTCARCNAEF